MPLLKCQVNGMRLREACETLSLATETGHSKFLSIVEQRLASEEYSVSEVMYGLGQSTFKNMRRKNEWQKPIPQILAEIIFGHSGIDVTVDQSLQTFLSLGFEIQLTLDVERHNEEINGSVTVDLKNLGFEIHEACTVATDPRNEEFELNVRIGFENLRLSVSSEAQVVTSNSVVGETPNTPDQASEPDYYGWFEMRLSSRDPLSWLFFSKVEGETLTKKIQSDGMLAQIRHKTGSPIGAELTARREALKVRVISENEVRAPKKMVEQHRDKMCAAVARKSISGSGTEYVIYRKSLSDGGASA